MGVCDYKHTKCYLARMGDNKQGKLLIVTMFPPREHGTLRIPYSVLLYGDTPYRIIVILLIRNN